ncbi:alpha/beta hydrolase [Kitasatospora sp. NPDC051914]|uniref:alpha/beta fold hydrolase n=1 Tax=Kitasatospora sp. NPDC051914 TaxID=3154945 RepID=UPI00341F2167
MTPTALLPVPGALLHHQVRGSGPLLLVAQSGEGDADRSRDLVDRLAADFTVVTYDRRGLSRSLPDDPSEPVAMATHADDAHRLLTELTDRPALMLGCSFGAAIGLHLAARRPGLLHTLIAHEPAVPELLPAGERADTERELRAVTRTYREEGWLAAVRRVTAVLGIDPHHQDTEPDVTAEPITEARAANFAGFLTRDIDTILGGGLEPADLDALRNGPTRIVPAVGRTTPHQVFDRRCAEILAGHLGTDPVEFPGGHNGNLTHPRAFATRLTSLLPR